MKTYTHKNLKYFHISTVNIDNRVLTEKLYIHDKLYIHKPLLLSHYYNWIYLNKLAQCNYELNM